MRLIAYASDGVPRCLNQLADHSLMQTFLAGSSTVSETVVRQALADVQHLPLRWNPSALHERSVRPAVSATEVADTSEFTVGQSQIEGETTDSRDTACFEFGAGDSTPVAEPEPSTIELGSERISQLALPVEESSVLEFGADVETDADAESEAAVEETTDDDGPPLFAWLAKPEKIEATTAPSASDFSSSSFTIPTRGRNRAPLVEHEVVSTAPLKGKELASPRSASPVRAVSPINPRPLFMEQDFPAEEVIIDGYARLDAPLSPMFPRSAPTLPLPAIITEMPAVHETATQAIEIDAPQASAIFERTATVAQEAQDSLNEAIRNAVRTDLANQPLDRIDAIYALIDESDSPSGSANSVELITDYGVERIDVDLPSNAELPSGVTAAHHLPLDLEDWIGSTVVEVGRDLQKSMAASFPEHVNRQRANKLEQLLDGIERASRFDVVEPDATAETTTVRVDPPAEVAEAGAVPAPKYDYKNFFSGLRRRQLR